eukprot:TRINITY_DN14231_c0_g1_i1.p1 TRINITY_DN14231_c0_g1~~TRINITY_DN14231_c0_g1_i1.p1  ORF type:complete len:209 (+),score=25.48 TRINITY_DN14231_c0_g1_i1:46-672(+)
MTYDPNGTPPQSPRAYLLVHNIAKKANIGNIARSAAAFGVQEVVTYGHKPSAMDENCVRVSNFSKLSDAIAYLKSPPRNCWICGIEIDPQAQPVDRHPFRGNTCFVLGNEGHGLDQRLMQVCDQFVYIPQYGNGTASLNVTVAGSIVFHHFGIWAQKPVQRSGDRYGVSTQTIKPLMAAEDDVLSAEVPGFETSGEPPLEEQDGLPMK